MQSSARRSYRAVVIPTDALLTFGMLKLTSLILAGAVDREGKLSDARGGGKEEGQIGTGVAVIEEADENAT